MRPLDWVGEAARREFKELPGEIQRSFGWSLLFVQGGETPGNAKPWKGLGPGVFVRRFKAAEADYLANYVKERW